LLSKTRLNKSMLNCDTTVVPESMSKYTDTDHRLTFGTHHLYFCSRCVNIVTSATIE